MLTTPCRATLDTRAHYAKHISLEYEAPVLPEDIEQVIAAKVAKLTPAQLLDFIDLNDVVFTADSEYLTNWRRQVVECLIDAINDGEECALDFWTDAEVSA